MHTQMAETPPHSTDAHVCMPPQEPVVPMCFLRVRPIGVMQMLDQGEQDDKLIAVHADDPEYKGFTDISQLPPHRHVIVAARMMHTVRLLPEGCVNPLCAVQLHLQCSAAASAVQCSE